MANYEVGYSYGAEHFCQPSVYQHECSVHSLHTPGCDAGHLSYSCQAYATEKAYGQELMLKWGIHMVLNTLPTITLSSQVQCCIQFSFQTPEHETGQLRRPPFNPQNFFLLESVSVFNLRIPHVK